MKYPSTELKPEWVYAPITPEIVEWCKSFGEFLSPACLTDSKKPLTTSQLRRFFGEVKRIKMQKVIQGDDVAMLNPQLAYAVGRDKDNFGKNKTRIAEFQQQLSKAISAIRFDEHLAQDYDHFIQIFEAIVAYHKYYGGKENTK